MAANYWSSLQIINDRRLNSLFNLISYQPDIDKIYLHAKYPYEANDQLLINKRKNKDLKHLNDCKAFIEYPNDMDDTYKNIEKYNLNRKRETLIVFDDMIGRFQTNKNLNKLHLIIHQILTLTTLWIFTKNVL